MILLNFIEDDDYGLTIWFYLRITSSTYHKLFLNINQIFHNEFDTEF